MRAYGRRSVPQTCGTWTHLSVVGKRDRSADRGQDRSTGPAVRKAVYPAQTLRECRQRQRRGGRSLRCSQAGRSGPATSVVHGLPAYCPVPIPFVLPLSLRIWRRPRCLIDNQQRARGEPRTGWRASQARPVTRQGMLARSDDLGEAWMEFRRQGRVTGSGLFGPNIDARGALAVFQPFSAGAPPMTAGGAS